MHEKFQTPVGVSSSKPYLSESRRGMDYKYGLWRGFQSLT